MLLGLILGVVLGTYVLVFGFVKNINEWRYVSSLGQKKHSLPPGDMGWPLLGNMLSFLNTFCRSQDPDTFIYNLVARYGRTGIYKTHLFGSPSIIVSIPETCRKVLTDDERFIMGYPKSTRQLTGKTFHSMPSSKQKRLRRLTTAPINGHEELAMYIGYIEDTVIKSLDGWSSMNEPVELLKVLISEFTFKVITHIFVGSSAESIMSLMEKHWADLVNGLISPPINIPGFAFYKALKARNILVKTVQGVLDERRDKSTQINDPNKKKEIIDRLMKSEDENGQKLADEDIIDLLIMFVIAGFETSAHVALWAIIYLHDHPEMLQKAKEEQEQIVKNRPSTQKGLILKDIKEMNYLQKIIDETLRRITPAFCTFREATVDVNINGFFIPKGWKVIVWNRAVHMDPEVYPNPKEFIPTRCEKNNSKAGSFLPFGVGSRICPGADLAKLESFIFLHYFLLNYKLEQINPRCPIVYLPAPRPADNCLAKIRKVE